MKNKLKQILTIFLIVILCAQGILCASAEGEPQNIILHFSGATSSTRSGEEVAYGLFKNGSDFKNLKLEDIYYVNQTKIDENGIFKMNIPIKNTISDYMLKSSEDGSVIGDKRSIYVSSDGSDAGSGVKEEPLNSFEKALQMAYEGDTIVFLSDFTLPKTFVWPQCEGVNVTSENNSSLDISAIKPFNINSDAVIDNIQFVTTHPTSTEESARQGELQVIYANGHSVKFGENYTNTDELKLYGGANSKDVASTDLTVLGGKYLRICGGGNSGNVLGDTNLTVGGNSNSDYTVNDSASDYVATFIYGGGYKCRVNGSTNITLGGNAVFAFVYGASWGIDDAVGVAANVTVNGGRFMNVIGGSGGGVLNADTNVTMNNGTAEAIFGGNGAGNNLVGNIKININGGEITRRIIGGCYNSSAASFVTGNITMTFSGSPKLNTGNGLSLINNNDKLIYLGSRNVTTDAGIKTLVYNNDLYKDSSRFAGTYNYLVKASAGGTVKCAEAGTLNIEPDAYYEAYIDNQKCGNEYALINEVTDVVFKTETGIKKVEYDENDKNVSYVVKDDSGTSSYLLIALYDTDNNNKMEHISITNCTTSNEVQNIDISDFPTLENKKYTISAYIWNGITLKPLCEKMSIDIK